MATEIDISSVNFHTLGVNSHLNRRLKKKTNPKDFSFLGCPVVRATKLISFGADLLLKSVNSLKYPADGII